MKYETKFLTEDALKKAYPELNKYFYKVSPMWLGMVKKMSQVGWRFVQFVPPFNMRRPGPYGCYIFEREVKEESHSK